MSLVKKLAQGGVVALAAAIALSGCSAASNDSTKTITIGTSNDAPFSYTDEAGNLVGIDGEMWNEIAKCGGWKTEVYVTDFATLIPSLQSKKIDVIVDAMYITDERKKAVDFSSGYYDVSQTVITVKGSKIANAKSIADLKGAKLGAQVGTTSYSTITDVIQPTQSPAVFDTNDVAKQALANGQIDGLVVDLPTAFYITAVDLENGLIVGQFPAKAGGEQFGLVLSKGSKLTKDVTAAVDALRANGTLAKIADAWLASTVGAPVLK